jgi:hypothetical protein
MFHLGQWDILNRQDAKDEEIEKFIAWRSLRFGGSDLRLFAYFIANPAFEVYSTRQMKV